MADRRLQVFRAVATHLSFTRAAEALLMTQPAVTFQIRQLEEQYNARLFERNHGRITLTAAGEMVLAYSEKILSLHQELESRLSEQMGEMRGTLLLGASSTIAEYFLPPILRDFNALYPQVRPRILVGNSSHIEKQIAERKLEIGLVESATHLPNLQLDPCCSDELQVVCAPDYPLAGMSAISPKALLEYEFIAREPGSGTREVTDAYFLAAGVAPDKLKTLMELGSTESLKGVVSTGLGFAVLPSIAFAKEQQLGSLVAVPLEPPLKRQLAFISAEDKFRSRLVTTFVAFTKQKLREFIF